MCKKSKDIKVNPGGCPTRIFLEKIGRLAPPPEEPTFEVAEQVEIQIKYEGYIERQERDQERFTKAETLPMPEGIDYADVHGLPAESRQRLEDIRPVNFGQASRISGVRASDISILHVYLEKRRREKAQVST